MLTPWGSSPCLPKPQAQKLQEEAVKRPSGSATVPAPRESEPRQGCSLGAQWMLIA